MNQIVSADVEALLALANPDPDETLRAMTEHGRDRGFPIVGPDVGQFLRFLATTVDASRVFEFGSGFGYSGAWWLPALPADGELVLTDYDADNLAEAEDFLEPYRDGTTVHYAAGDAMATYGAHEGPWDVVLVDHDKTMYVDAFDLAKPDVAPGGVVVADNMMAGPVEPEHVTEALTGGDPVDEDTAGVVEYIETVRDDPAFETAFVPLGEGVAVSVKRP
jgi:predicted O-methyltransferase YrrM